MLSSLPLNNIIDLTDEVEDSTFTTECVRESYPVDRQTAYRNNEPFRFLDLHPEIRSNILNMVLCQSDIVYPYYNDTSVELPAPTDPYENVDTAVLRVNKQIHLEGVRALYGGNAFILNNAEIALWWLQRIGANVARIRTAHILLEAGEIENNPFRVRKETVWLNLVAWLRPRQKLDTLSVSFRFWTDDTDARIAALRDHVLALLFRYRDLKQVTIHGFEYMSDDYADELEEVMTWEEGATSERVETIIGELRPPMPTYLFRR